MHSLGKMEKKNKGASS